MLLAFLQEEEVLLNFVYFYFFYCLFFSYNHNELMTNFNRLFSFKPLLSHALCMCSVFYIKVYMWGWYVTRSLRVYLCVWNSWLSFIHFKSLTRERERYFVSRVVLDIKRQQIRRVVDCLYKGMLLITLHSIAVLWDFIFRFALAGT